MTRSACWKGWMTAFNRMRSKVSVSANTRLTGWLRINLSGSLEYLTETSNSLSRRMPSTARGVGKLFLQFRRPVEDQAERGGSLEGSDGVGQEFLPIGEDVVAVSAGRGIDGKQSADSRHLQRTLA